MKKIALIFLCVSIMVFANAQTKKKDCIHRHYDNATAVIANCETIHIISNKKLANRKSLMGKLYFTLDGVRYECKENTVKASLFVEGKNYKIYISGEINDSSMIDLTYRVPIKNTPVGSNTPPQNYVNLEAFYISINNKPYANTFKLNDTKTTMNVTVQCAYKYFGTTYLLNGIFSGQLKDKEGNMVNISNGVFLTKKPAEDDLKD